jgi:glycosyltransferase involved in cell wall biosynthesis
MRDRLREIGIEALLYDFAPVFDWKFDPHRLFGYFAMVRRARRFIATNRIDMIHCNSGAPTQWIGPAARRSRVPFIVHLHCPYSRRERYTLGLHLAPAVVGCSRSVLDGLLHDGYAPSAALTIHNGIDFARLDAGDQQRSRSELDIPPDAIVIASVGSLIHRKGHDVAVEAVAMAQAREQGRRLILLVVGDGPERKALERLAKERSIDARFLGYRNDVGPILRSCSDIFVLASREEAFPLAILEAGHCGLPIIAARVGGASEILEHGRNGLLVEIEQVAELAEGIVTLVDAPDLRRALGSRIADDIDQRFTSPQMARAFERVYETLGQRYRDRDSAVRMRPDLTPYRRLLWRGRLGAKRQGQ